MLDKGDMRVHTMPTESIDSLMEEYPYMWTSRFGKPIKGLNDVNLAAFSKKVPVAKCLEELKCAQPKPAVQRRKKSDATGYFAELPVFAKASWRMVF